MHTVNLGHLFADSQKLDFILLYVFARPPPFVENKQKYNPPHTHSATPRFLVTVIIIIAYNEDIFVNVDCANTVKIVWPVGTAHMTFLLFNL